MGAFLRTWLEAGKKCHALYNSRSRDHFGRRLSRTLPEGQTEHFSYDSLGRLVAVTDFNGYTTEFVYDVNHNIVERIADPAHPSLALPHAIARVHMT